MDALGMLMLEVQTMKQILKDNLHISDKAYARAKRKVAESNRQRLEQARMLKYAKEVAENAEALQ